MQTRILLVEDDATARMLLAAALEHAGHYVTAAPSGEAALEELARQVFDVVVTDIKMRRVDGVQVLQAARSQPYAPEVILLTGYGSLETSIAALRAGACDYLLKPCDPSELLMAVDKAAQRREADRRRALGVQAIAQGLAQLRDFANVDPLDPMSAPAPAEHFFTVGALTLDTFRHTVTFDEEVVHVTPIEFALLRCLAEARGRVVDYSTIIRHTHGYSVDDAEAQSLLKVHVRNLRRKLPHDYLVNVRSTGYMLVAPIEE